MEDFFIGVAEVSRILRVSCATVRRMVGNGRLKARRMGRRILITRESVIAITGGGRLYSLADLQSFEGISLARLHAMIKRGFLSPVRLGKRVLITKADLKKLIGYLYSSECRSC